MDQRDFPSLTQAFHRPTGDDAQAAAQLIAISGPLQGASFALEAESITIGRRPENTIRVPSHEVSKTHCTITRVEPDHFAIVDEGSKNGTFVNGRELKADERLQLTSGDTIAICDSTFFFLGPRGAADSSGSDEIRVDLDAAAKEAAGLIETCSDMLALRQSRRRR